MSGNFNRVKVELPEYKGSYFLLKELLPSNIKIQTNRNVNIDLSTLYFGYTILDNKLIGKSEFQIKELSGKFELSHYVGLDTLLDTIRFINMYRPQYSLTHLELEILKWLRKEIYPELSYV
jgi:hypothetical protein